VTNYPSLSMEICVTFVWK